MIVDVAAINRKHGLAIMDDGALVPVAVWFDRNGEECGPDEAIVAVVGPDAEGWWHPISLAVFEQATIH